MASFVINEWIWADLAEENGVANRVASFSVIEALGLESHQILVIRGSPFEQKLWDACRSGSFLRRQMAGHFYKTVYQDSGRCRIIDTAEVQPVSLAGVKHDDIYLIQAQEVVPGSIIVSTDEPLLRVLVDCGIPCEHRDPFIERLLSRKERHK